jgi:hypothetical protein
MTFETKDLINIKPKVVHEDWGMISYKVAWDRQTAEHAGMMEVKKLFREDIQG